MANDATKELANMAEIFKALGHPTRLWIAKNLEGRELCVCDIVAGTGEEFSSVSQHLNVLKKAHVVEGEKHGKHVFYRLVYPCIPLLISCMEIRDCVSRGLPVNEKRLVKVQCPKLLEHLQSQQS